MDALFEAKVALCIFERVVFRIDLLPSALHVTRRADDRSDSPEASHLATCAVGEMSGVSDAELLLIGAQVFHKRLSLHRRVGVFIAPGTVHGIQILGADGAFRIADNVPLRLQEQLNVVGVLLHHLPVQLRLQLKTTYSIESGLRELLTDWYNIDYVVEMDNDKIQDMSPGKKALVLLRLLISLAESKCPILIDQPEDDLDNRSIFDELITFIREKKVDRQIITVTHNANIVLGGDAELVIVANQRGKNSPNSQYQFEYRGGSIENNSPVMTDNNQPLLGILNQKGMQEHICEILEGGEQAFDLRRHKYHFINS